MPSDVFDELSEPSTDIFDEVSTEQPKAVDFTKSLAQPGQLTAQGTKPYAGDLSAGPFSPYREENMQEALGIYKSMLQPPIEPPHFTGTTPLGKIGAGIGNVAGGLYGTMASPAGLLTLPVAAESAPVRAAMAGLAAQQAGQSLNKMISGQGGLQEATEGLLTGALAAGMAPKIGAKGLELPREVPDITGPLVKPETPTEATQAPDPKVFYSSAEPKPGAYFSDLKSDADAYAIGRPTKAYSVDPKSPFDPATSTDTELLADYDKLGGIQEAPRDEAFRKKLKDAGYDSIVGGEKGFGGESNWIIPLDESIIKPKPESVTPPVTEPTPTERPQATKEQILGMGMALPSEFERSPETATSIKNSQVDVERQQRGLPPAIQPAKRSFGDVWDQAMATIDRDPSYQDKLISELEIKPRALTDLEDAMILHRQIDLQNEYGKATRDLAQAFEDGRTDDVEREKFRTAGLSDQLLKLYNLGKKVGTETGRGLNARKMMAYEDFSLAKMTLELRGSKGGRHLTDQQTEWVNQMNQRILETQKAYDDYRAASETRLAASETQRLIAEAQASNAPRFDKRILAQAEGIVKRMEDAAKPAADRLRERLSRLSAGVDPTIVVDAAIVGSAKIARLGLDLAKFTDEMVREFGEKIRPMIGDIWTEANKMVDAITTQTPEVKKSFKARSTLGEFRQDVVNKIKEKVADNKKGEITWYVQRLARKLVENGVTEREPLIDAVWDALKEAMPDMTRREAMDAISGYGDYKQLTKDAISVQLRGMKGEMQQIAKLEDMAAGEPPLKSGVERRTPTEAERQLIKLVNDAKVKFQVPVSDPSVQLKSALDTLKTTLTNRIADYQDRIARGDYAKRPRREVVLDPEASRLKAENEKVKKQFQRGVALERLKNAGAVERGANWVTKWRRGFLLSGPVTLAKLTSAAVQRMAFTPLEEAAGAGIGKIIPEVASRAPREGGFNSGAEARALTQGLTQGMKDAWDTLRKGQSELDVLYGKEALLPPSAIDFFGHVHGALKAPTKRAEFTRSMEKRTQFAIENGVDVSDPMVQSRLVIEAYKDANKSIFLQDNRVVDAYKRMLSGLEQKNKLTGEVPLRGKVAATAARVLLPIVKVPTNIVAETMQYATGTVTGSARLARAFYRGIETLQPEEADLIMRELKKGSIGSAVMLVGYFNPQVIGGYYQQGEKRKKGEAKPGTIQLYGYNIPSFILHNPLLETLQIGATVRRVADSKLKKGDKDTQGMGAGIYAGATGIATEVPFVREMWEVSKAFNPREKGAFWGEMGKSLLVPQLIQFIANQQDKNARGELRKRSPKTVLQHIETGIPYLRQRVPLAKTQP